VTKTAARIEGIDILRDGGTIMFKVVRDRQTTAVILRTPWEGKDVRTLAIGGKRPAPGDPDVGRLLADIDEWWNAFPAEQQTAALKALSHKGAFRDASPAMLEAIAASRVLAVREYVKKNYEEAPSD